MVSGTPKLTKPPPGRRGTLYEGYTASTPCTFLSSFILESGSRAACCPSGAPIWTLEAKYLAPPSSRALKCSAIEPIVVSAKMPITMPEMVRNDRSLRRARFRMISMSQRFSSSRSGLPSSSTAPSSLLLLTTPGEVAEVTTWA